MVSEYNRSSPGTVMFQLFKAPGADKDRSSSVPPPFDDSAVGPHESDVPF